MTSLCLTQMRVIRTTLIFALLTLASACMYGPANGETLPSTSTVVTFRGYALSPGRPVEIWSSATRNGAFRSFAFGRSSMEATTFPDGAKLYHWEVTGVVPAWTDTCSNREAFVKAVVDRGEQYTFDVVNAAGKTPRQCLQDAVAAGRSTVAAIEECKSPQSPVVRLQVAGSSLPVSYTGNITINSEASAARFRCLQTLNGDLTVTDVPVDVAFPRLRSISGSASLNYSVPTAPGEIASMRRITLPALASVGRDLILRAYAPHSQAFAGSFELSALSSVGQNVEVVVPDRGSIQGLPALRYIPGNLTVRGWGLAILPALSAVGADVDFKGLGNTSLRALRTVGGDLVVVDLYLRDHLLGLESVGGTLRLSHVDFRPTSEQPFALPRLTQVGTELIINGWYPDVADGDLSTNLTAVVPPDAVLGGLHISASTVSDLEGVTFNVAPTSPISFSRNGNLCESVIHAWLDQLPDWDGTRYLHANRSGC